MMAVTSLTPTPDPADTLSLVVRRPPRGQRSAPRFQLPAGDAPAGPDATGSGKPGKGAARRPGSAEPDPVALPGGEPPTPAGPLGPTLSPDQAEVANLPAPISATDAAPARDSLAATAESIVGEAVSARPRVAGATAGAVRQGERLPAEPGSARAADQGTARPAEPGHGTATGPTTDREGPVGQHPAAPPGSAQQPRGAGGAAAEIGSAEPATATRQAPVSPAAPAARRDRSTAPSAPPPTFRLEATAASATLEPAAQAGPASPPLAREAAPEPLQPADILIAPGGPGAGGLEVTIAAATPDLRDRFRAATGELQDELAAIGAEVDAIRVELRSDWADGSAGAGDRSAPEGEAGGGETAGADMSWGTGNAMLRLEDADQAADALDAGSQHDKPSGGQTEGGMGRDSEAGREVQRLRLLLDPARAGTDPQPGGAVARSANGRLHRIDRYA